MMIGCQNYGVQDVIVADSNDDDCVVLVSAQHMLQRQMTGCICKKNVRWSIRIYVGKN